MTLLFCKTRLSLPVLTAPTTRVTGFETVPKAALPVPKPCGSCLADTRLLTAERHFCRWGQPRAGVTRTQAPRGPFRPPRLRPLLHGRPQWPSDLPECQPRTVPPAPPHVKGTQRDLAPVPAQPGSLCPPCFQGVAHTGPGSALSRSAPSAGALSLCLANLGSLFRSQIIHHFCWEAFP